MRKKIILLTLILFNFKILVMGEELDSFDLVNELSKIEKHLDETEGESLAIDTERKDIESTSHSGTPPGVYLNGMTPEEKYEKFSKKLGELRSDTEAEVKHRRFLEKIFLNN